MKIFSIVGARPQFIKLAPLSAKLSKAHEEVIVHTGQHYDYALSEQIFRDLGIRKPDIHLESGPGTQSKQTADMMVKLEEAMVAQKPELVIVFGDTNSTLAAVLAASKLNIPIIHIEAGLRSYNRQMPEEVNRIAADHLSKYLFVPTLTAMDILAREGLAEASYLTGDIMVDTITENIGKAESKSAIIDTLGIANKKYSLLTLHRNYNVDDVSILQHILDELGKLDEAIIFPVHPRTRKMLPASYLVPSNIRPVDPQGYLDFIKLEHHSQRIITDSGGIQKEAYVLRKPCITLRTETEWVETVNEGWNLLLKPTDKNIAERINSFAPPEHQNDVFGKNVTDRMVAIINELN